MTWQTAVTVVVVALPIAARFIELRGRSNDAQIARIAYVLENTGSQDAVFDPSRTIGVLRFQVDRSSAKAAALAVVTPAMRAGDPELEALLRSGFEPTQFPDVWRSSSAWPRPAGSFAVEDGERP